MQWFFVGMRFIASEADLSGIGWESKRIIGDKSQAGRDKSHPYESVEKGVFYNMNIREKVEMLAQVATKELQSVNAPGAEIAVVYENEIIFAEGFGIANSETATPVTADMLFRIGSLTKMITAYSLMSLVYEQHLNVHVPIAEYVSGLPSLLVPLTIHQLLSHTAGLKDDDSDYGPHDEGVLGQAVRSYDERHFFAKSGKMFSYSGLGYAVASVVIEVLSKKPYAHVVADRILKPLKMERSTFSTTMAMTYPFSQGHIVDKSQRWSVVRPYDDNATRWPAGFLFSNVIELARLCIAFMNGGCIDGEQVLAPEVISALTQPYAKPLDAPDRRYYGYGLYLDEYHGMHTLDHSGGRRGFCSYLQMFPEQRFAVIELVNQANVLLRKTLETAMKLFLAPKNISPTPSSSLELSLTQEELTSLIGRYASPDINATATSDIQLVSEEDKLMIQFGDVEQPLPVVRKSETRFAVVLRIGLQPVEFAFQKGASRQEGYLYWANRAYKRVA